MYLTFEKVICYRFLEVKFFSPWQAYLRPIRNYRLDKLCLENTCWAVTLSGIYDLFMALIFLERRERVKKLQPTKEYLVVVNDSNCLCKVKLKLEYKFISGISRAIRDTSRNRRIDISLIHIWAFFYCSLVHLGYSRFNATARHQPIQKRHERTSARFLEEGKLR